MNFWIWKWHRNEVRTSEQYVLTLQMYTNVTKCIRIRWQIREISIRGESLFSRAKHLVSVNLMEFVFRTYSVRFRQRIKFHVYEI